MNKKIILIVIASLSITYKIFAQQTTASPYSYYGVGALHSKATIEESAMASMGIFADSTRISMQNVAGLSKLKFTAFSAGASFDNRTIASEKTSFKSQNTAVDYLALGFPIIKNLGVAVGVKPYSSVGYKLVSVKNDESYQLEGSGNVNQAFLSVGYHIYKGLSVGASAKMNFGKIEMTDLLKISGVEFYTQEYNQSLLRGFSANIGLSYEQKLKKGLKISSSFLFTPQSSLSSENQRIITTLGYGLSGSSSTISLVEKQKEVKDLDAIGLKKTTLTLPSEFSVGVGIGKELQWFAGVEYSYSNQEKFSNPFLSTDIKYENGYKIAFGGFYLPDFNSFTSYFKRVTYRAGFRYEKTGISINNQLVDDFGITFGLTLPVKAFSNFTTAFEIGKKGTTQQNLVKENYFSVKIGFTLNDKWFQKTKYQ